MSLGPTLVQLFWVFPFTAHAGYLGLELGFLTPLFVFVFNGQTGLFRAARGRRFDLAVVRVADGGARSLSIVEKIRARNTAERIVGIFSEDVNAETGSKIAEGLDEVIFEPFGYADFIGAVGAIIAPNELQEAAL